MEGDTPVTTGTNLKLLKLLANFDLILKIRFDVQGQISQWEENLERLQVEQFRLRCYMASLQSSELPNPKVRSDERERCVNADSRLD